MGRTYDVIDENLASFLESQPVFFVSTAPLGAEGHLNCSPKGNRDELAVLDERTIAYLDQTGSGAETIAHLRENGRIVLLFCAFEGSPRIVRVHGAGEAVPVDDPRFVTLSERFSRSTDVGARSIVLVSATRISDSCGYGVPLMSFEGHRPVMDRWAERKGAEGIREYWASHNAVSLDALPGLDLPG